MIADVHDLLGRARGFERALTRLERRVDWQVNVTPFHHAAACYHGGAFFQAIGDHFRTLERKDAAGRAQAILPAVVSQPARSDRRLCGARRCGLLPRALRRYADSVRGSARAARAPRLGRRAGLRQLPALPSSGHCADDRRSRRACTHARPVRARHHQHGHIDRRAHPARGRQGPRDKRRDGGGPPGDAGRAHSGALETGGVDGGGVAGLDGPRPPAFDRTGGPGARGPTARGRDPHQPQAAVHFSSQLLGCIRSVRVEARGGGPEHHQHQHDPA